MTIKEFKSIAIDCFISINDGLMCLYDERTKNPHASMDLLTYEALADKPILGFCFGGLQTDKFGEKCPIYDLLIERQEEESFE